MNLKFSLILSIFVFCLTNQYIKTASTDAFPIEQRVDNIQEWIKLGPRPLMSMDLVSGSQDLFKLCKPVQPSIDHYVDEPIDFDFPYHFSQKGVFYTEYFDKGENFIIYREDIGKNFYVFDIKLQGQTLGMPQKWELDQEVRDTDATKIRFFKDMMNLELEKDGNHIAIQYDETKLAIVHFDNNLNAKNTFYVDTKISDFQRMRFYDKKLYILKSNNMHILSFPNGFNMPFETEVKKYLREYNDFTINRIDIFLFVRGYSELIASPDANPEGLKIKKLAHKFRHGRFHDSGFGTSILSYTDKEFSHTKYFVSYQASSQSKRHTQKLNSVEEKMEHSLNMSEIPAPRISDPKKFRILQSSIQVYYIYPFDKHSEVEVYLKGSKLGKSVMVQHMKGKIVTVDAAFYTDLTGDRMIVEKVESHPLRSKLFKVFSNYMHATIECDAPVDRQTFEGKDRPIEIRVVNAAFIYDLKVIFGQHAWNKRKLEPISSSSSSHPISSSSSSQHTNPISSSSSSQHGNNKTDKKPTHPKPISLHFLLTVSLGCALILAILLYCYRRSKLQMLKKINDLVSMDQTQDLDNTEDLDQTDVSEISNVTVEGDESTIRPRQESEGVIDSSGLG